jgi:transketolase
MRVQWAKTLLELAKQDERIFALTADTVGMPLAEFKQNFPERVLDVGVAEANMVGISAGLALCGKIPFAATIAVFASMRCYEQIRSDVCYQQINVKIVGVGAGFKYGPLGATHHATEDIAIMRALPNMTIVVPADGRETRKATAALAAHPGPAYLRLGRSGEPEVYRDDYAFELGRAVPLRAGTDLTIISAGLVLPNVLQAADALHAKGIHARILNMHTVKPLDVSAVRAAARETGAILSVEEHSIIGGLGSAIAEILAEEQLAIPFKRLGLPDVFSGIGTQEQLWEKYGMGVAHIVKAAEGLCNSGTCRSSSS